MIRVLIVDDHALVRVGLEQLLNGADDIEVVGSAVNGHEAVALAERTCPDVILMDLSMPDLDGIAATREILRRAPSSHIVALTSFSDRDRILSVLDAGAVGYLLKDVEPDELCRGVRAASRGESPLNPKAAQQLLAARRRPPPHEQLTDREQEVLALLAKGTPNKVIAQRLAIAEKTVKNHVSNIFQTLGVTDRTQAAIWFQEHAAELDRP